MRGPLLLQKLLEYGEYIVIITIPKFISKIYSIKVCFFIGPNRNTINAFLNEQTNNYEVDPPEKYDFYLIEINERFYICDLNSDKTLMIRNDVYATLSVLEKRTYNNILIQTNLCTEIDIDNRAKNQISIVTRENPLVIIAFEINTLYNKPCNFVLTVEWVHENQAYWITSRPYELKGKKYSYNALKITPDLPNGFWSCNLYIHETLYSVQNFQIISSKARTRAAFLDIYG